MKIDTKSSLSFLKYFLKPFYWPLFLGAVVMLVTDICQLMVPKIITSATEHFRGLFNDKKAVEDLHWDYVWIYLVVVTVLFLTRHQWRIFTVGSARKMGASMKEAFFSHLTALSQKEIDEMKAGDLMSRVTSDINAVQRMVAFAFVVALDCAIHVGAILPILYFLNKKLFVLVLIPLVIGVVIFQIVRKKLFAATKVYQGMTADLAGMAEESFSGISVIKSFGTEEAVEKKFNKQSKGMVSQKVRMVLWESFLAPLANLLIAVCLFLVLIKGAPMVLSDQASLTFESLFEFVLYVCLLEWPIRAVGMVVGMIQKGMVSLERLREIFAIDPQQLLESNGGKEAVTLTIKGHFEFKHLNFYYKEHQVLHDITVDIPAGSKVGVIGKVGSGKSSLMSLIPCLYAPEPGQLFVDGKDVREYGLESLRQVMGCVTQESLLFSETIKNNVLFGKDEEGDDEQVKEWLASCQVLDDIEALPEKLDSFLGERGVNLSGGQKQRVTLARALAVEATIYVFDDCFSALDSHTEKKLLQAIFRICEGHTTFIASHRMSTIQNCDMLLVLDRGRLVDKGTPAELSQRPEGYYARMVARQKSEIVS